MQVCSSNTCVCICICACCDWKRQAPLLWLSACSIICQESRDVPASGARVRHRYFSERRAQVAAVHSVLTAQHREVPSTAIVWVPHHHHQSCLLILKRRSWVMISPPEARYWVSQALKLAPPKLCSDTDHRLWIVTNDVLSHCFVVARRWWPPIYRSSWATERSPSYSTCFSAMTSPSSILWRPCRRDWFSIFCFIVDNQ